MREVWCEGVWSMNSEDLTDDEVIKKELADRKKRYTSRNKKRNTIKKDLERQLKDKNVTHSHYVDLIKDYLSLWDIKNELIHDIDTKGVSVMYKNGANQYGWKKNDSVRELTTVNNQMLKLLSELGLKVNDLEAKEDEEFVL